MSEPITFTAYAVNNLCYKANRKMPYNNILSLCRG